MTKAGSEGAAPQDERQIKLARAVQEADLDRLTHGNISRVLRAAEDVAGRVAAGRS